MLSKLNRLFQQFVVNEEQGGGDKLDLPLATAVLMLEIARADMDVDEQELARIHSLLCKDFDLDSDRAEALIELARQEVDSAVSAYPFTRLLVDELDMKQRETVIEYLWRVARLTRNWIATRRRRSARSRNCYTFRIVPLSAPNIGHKQRSRHNQTISRRGLRG